MEKQGWSGGNEKGMFSEMLSAARQRLRGRDPEQLARLSGAVYDSASGCYTIETLGQTVMLNAEELTFTPEPEPWHQLVMLHYLDLCDGTLPTGELISFSMLRDGLVRGGDFDARFETAAAGLMRRITPRQLEQRCRAMGGETLDTNADYAVRLPFLPYVPLILKLWFADDEFDASGRLMLDRSADHCLTVEDAVTVGELLLYRLEH